MEDLELKVYNKLCCGCLNEKRCHDECENCDKYYEELDKELNNDITKNS